MKHFNKVENSPEMATTCNSSATLPGVGRVSMDLLHLKCYSACSPCGGWASLYMTELDVCIHVHIPYFLEISPHRGVARIYRKGGLSI